MAKRVTANSIDSVKLAQVTHDVVAERWDNFDLTEFLVYLVDTVSSKALPYLAEQFNVDGLRGFAVAGSEDEQREMIKQAIRLYKFMGTPFAIRLACQTAGIGNVILTEGIASYPPDPATDWARFSVLVDLPDGATMNVNSFSGLRDFINAYKPERCHLAELGISVKFFDTDKLFRDIFSDVDEIPIYDGTHTYDGSINYGGKMREQFFVEIITDPFQLLTVIVDDLGDYIYDDKDKIIITI